ncbi:TPS27 [Citrus sinensis]|nr:TPS27 [Citrus sinensis]
MALNLLSPLPATCNFTRLSFRLSSNVNGPVPLITRVQYRMAASTTTIKPADQSFIRRSADYGPTIWSFDYIQSLDSKYNGESYARQLEKLKEQVRAMLQGGDKVVDLDPLHQLELIDNLHRLGVSYHFEDEIKRTLERICNKNTEKSLYTVALKFRILRQYGYDTPVKETFSCFMDEKGSFKSSSHGDDCKGMLALYEAAYLLVEGESSIFRDTISFTTAYLKEWAAKHDNNKHHNEYLCTLVNHALELPLHWRTRRLEARWFIDVYQSGPNTNPILLDLAKLDFNIVQAVHQEDIKYASRWWKKTGLGERLNFARDRIMENFFWTVGVIFEPNFGYCRRMSTMVNALITTIDDVYDVYGTLDELELFTDAVERWDATTIEQLPDYMKLCFHALHNSINEMAFDALRDQGVGMVISYLKKAWADICKTYLVEAKWYNNGYIPTLQEYMENAWISISAPVILVHAYTYTANPITKEGLEFVKDYPNIIRWSSIILRLADDLGTSSDELKRGDVYKSIQCYMHEAGVSEREAREHIHDLIAQTWMKMNRDRFGNPHFVSDVFVGIAMNLARMSQCMYQFGDGHGHGVQEITKARVLSLIVDPIV